MVSLIVEFLRILQVTKQTLAFTHVDVSDADISMHPTVVVHDLQH